MELLEAYMTLIAFARRLFLVLSLMIFVSGWRASAYLITTNVYQLTNNPTIGRVLYYTNTLPNVLSNLVLHYTLSSSFTYQSATSSVGTITLNGSSNSVTLNLGTLNTNAGFTLNVQFATSALGYFTNAVVLAGDSLGVSFSNSSDEIIQLSPALSDLAVGVSGPTNTLVAGDYATYLISVTNKGPAAAPSVVLSNYFGLGGRVVSLSSTAASTNSTNLTFSLGTLASNATASIRLVLEVSTNAGTFNFVSTAYSLTNGDAIWPNDSATNSITTTNGVNVSSFSVDPLPTTVNTQTGLFEQEVTVSNTGGSTLGSIRLLVGGLTLRHATLTDRLYNAIGTNQGKPYVVVPGTLAPGQSVTVLLEFFFPTRTAAPGLTYTALAVPTVDFTQNPGSGTAVTLTNWLAGASMYLEFSATAGQRYTIFYSGDTSFTNTQAAHPSIVADGNRVQWIDSGPPKTSSAPGAVPARFYRVIATP